MRISRPILIAASTAALLGGCSVGPAYVAPQVAAPPAFLGGPAAEAATAQAAKVDLVNWWRSFDDPLLASLVERALAQNLDLQQASARVVQARAALRNANAQLLPAGQVSGQASETYQSLETPQGRIASALPGFERGENDLFGGKDAARDAARADWQASAAAAAAARLAVAAQTADTYVAIRSLQARLDVARGAPAGIDQVRARCREAGPPSPRGVERGRPGGAAAPAPRHHRGRAQAGRVQCPDRRGDVRILSQVQP
jgi:outer membrane protein TolC